VEEKKVEEVKIPDEPKIVEDSISKPVVKEEIKKVDEIKEVKSEETKKPKKKKSKKVVAPSKETPLDEHK